MFTDDVCALKYHRPSARRCETTVSRSITLQRACNFLRTVSFLFRGSLFRCATTVHVTLRTRKERAAAEMRMRVLVRRDPRRRGAHGRVKEAKINCNLIRESQSGPIAIRCASAGREEWRPCLERDALYTSRLRGLAANADGP
jgi:hypothetical protein